MDRKYRLEKRLTFSLQELEQEIEKLDAVYYDYVSYFPLFYSMFNQYDLKNIK